MEQEYENTNKRDFGNDEDLQMALDHNQEYQYQKLKDKVLFAAQGLGSVRTISKNGRQFDAYIKGPHCQQSVRDLVKFIKTDIPDNPRVKLILSKLNIVQSDLNQLLLLQVEDKKLSFWLIILLSYLTSKPSDQLNSDQKQTLYAALRQYKQSFTKHECLTILTVHIAEYFKTPKQARQRAHYQMLEHIVLLIRNFLQIPDSKNDNNSLHNHFLTTLIKQEMFNPILYLIQNQKGEIMSKIDIPLLQIFYYTFTCFDPKILYNPEQNKNYFKQVLASKANKVPLPPRHSRFMPNFKIKSDVGISRISHNLNKDRQPILNQRQVPHRTVQLKKVQKIQLDYLPENFMKMEFQVIQEGKQQTRTIQRLAYQISRQFIQVQLPQLKDLIFDQIYKETAKVTSQNVIQYMLLCNWALQMTRAKYKFEKSQAQNQVERQNVEFDLSQIAEIMQNAHFQLIYKTLFKQATREKKKQFKVNTFNAALKLFLNYLNVISDISISLRQLDRKNANTLMANIFRHDIARILKIGFLQITHQGILSTLILTCHKFYSMLSKFSDGKVLTIRTDKLLKRKSKQKMRRQEDEEQDMKEFISSDSQDDEDGSKSYNQDQNDQKPNKKQKVKNYQQKNGRSRTQQPSQDVQMFQQRKFNQISEFAIIAQYAIITKYLMFLKNQRFLQNTNQFNDAIFFYFENITRLLRGQWLFFQAETLIIFQSILTAASQFVKKQKKNIQKIRLVRRICKQFLHLLKSNNLALVESLFKYPNLQIKQKILKNYDQPYEGPVQTENNMFTDE